MRLRLQTSPPLPLVKAWIAFPSLGHETIYGLKVYICTTLQPLQDARVQPAQVKFELDGFELLDDTPVTELLHENDLLVAISRPETINPEKNKKRKIDDVVEPTVRRSVSKKRKLPSPSTSSDSDSSDSDSSSSSSSSDSESDSSQDSDSESVSDDSSSSSSSSGAPSERPVKKSKAQRNVPPGQGTTRTRSRNLRRRAARRSEANPASLAPPLKSTSEANAVPLGTASLPSNSLALSMFSLGNKNKKKGFKQALRPPSSQKIVFSEPELPTPLLAPDEATSTPAATTHSSYVYTFPSDLQTQGKLPSNVFVTSVDVEEGMWPLKSKKKKTKKQPVQEQEYDPKEEEVTLPYDDEPQPPSDSNADLWASAQSTFDALPLVTGVEQLAVGAIVGWKALALNPATFSPEIMLHLSAVQTIDPAYNQIVAKPLPRPETEVSEETEVEPAESETTDLSMVRDLGWRVVA